MKQLDITELDFDTIKEAIKNYYRNGTSTFKDWDFEGSGLNIILDILAYNTHYNAMLAHLAANEGFLGSAQLRKNVVARAKTLGYLPHSVTAAYSDIHLTGDGIDDLTEVPKNTRFSTSIDGIEYSFVTAEDFTNPEEEFNSANDSQGESRIRIFEGEFKTIRYTFNSAEKRQKFVIPDVNADISTKINSAGNKLLSVNTYPHTNTSDVTSYTQFTELSEITATSDVFFISENPDGYYVIEFGDDILGKKPANGSIVEIEYFVTNGANANGASSFSLVSTLTNSEGTPLDSLSVDNNHENSTISAGGGTRESIEQIRANAPISFAAQDRAVTADDYKAIILNEVSAQAVSVWGGEDNQPVQLGTVFISAKYANDEVLTLAQKNALKAILEDKGVLTLTHTFVDPDFTYLYFNVTAKYNPNLTSLSQSSMISSIRDTMTDFDNANLEDYNSVFRYSQFLQFIDNSDPAILSTVADVFCYKKFGIGSASYTIDFKFELEKDVDVDYITSDTFTFTSGDDTTTEYSLRTIGSGTSDSNLKYIVIQDSAGNKYSSNGIETFGQIDLESGLMSLGSSSVHAAFPTNITSTESIIKIYCRPASDDVLAKRNTVIQIDVDQSSVNALIDNIALGGNAGIKNYRTINRE